MAPRAPITTPEETQLVGLAALVPVLDGGAPEEAADGASVGVVAIWDDAAYEVALAELDGTPLPDGAAVENPPGMTGVSYPVEMVVKLAQVMRVLLAKWTTRLRLPK